MSGNFELDVDIEIFDTFHQEYNEISNDIDIEISSLSENTKDTVLVNSLLEKLDTLQTNAMTCYLYPIADAIEIVANIVSKADQYPTREIHNFTDILFQIMDNIAFMLNSVEKSQSINFNDFSKIQSVGRIMTEITTDNFQQKYDDVICQLTGEGQNTNSALDSGGVDLFADDEIELFSDDGIELFGNDIELFDDDLPVEHLSPTQPKAAQSSP
ncbi:MAG: hypothetical protein HOM11_08550 [Methylococcales bacterium]|nr:hypothetical protein [Methylococcales bacterium]MBT7442563.1 hypothetical protein [Methylococcales bacterium]